MLYTPVRDEGCNTDCTLDFCKSFVLAWEGYKCAVKYVGAFEYATLAHGCEPAHRGCIKPLQWHTEGPLCWPRLANMEVQGGVRVDCMIRSCFA